MGEGSGFVIATKKAPTPPPPPEPVVKFPRRLGVFHRKLKDSPYGCPLDEIAPRIQAWCSRNKCDLQSLWERNENGNLIRGSGLCSMRQKMVKELCMDAPYPVRISPGDIGRMSDVDHSTLFTIAWAIRKRHGLTLSTKTD